MRSSETSSAPAISPSGGASPPRSFHLTGRSRPLDPRTHAIRSDIADIRLADLVFAPHYAEALPRRVAMETTLRADRGAGSEALACLSAGEPFDLLDITGGIAWGIAVERGLVGYVDADALAAG